MQVIAGLLHVKRLRQECREVEMWGAHRAFEGAAQLLRKATEHKQRRDRERADQERAMYDEVCSRIVVVRDLHELRFEVDQLKEDGRKDAQAVTDAEAERRKRRQLFDEATVSWRVAAHARQRFEELAKEERAGEAIAAERLAELELEEHRPRDTLAEAMGALGSEPLEA